MRDATGAPQSVVVLGGGSDIAAAIVDALADDRLRRVVLATRTPAALDARAQALRTRGVDVEVVAYDALDAAAHDAVLDAAAAGGDIDVVLVAFGVLGEPFDVGGDPADSASLATVGFAAAVAATQAGARVLQDQGHGTLVVLSSVAGRRVRPENAVYGASKAGLDAFTIALADALHGSGVHVMVVRPGFVRTKMTAGRPDAPFATTAPRVAADVVAGLRRNRRVVWSPPLLGPVFAVLGILPAALWRRLVS